MDLAWCSWPAPRSFAAIRPPPIGTVRGAWIRRPQRPIDNSALGSSLLTAIARCQFRLGCYTNETSTGTFEPSFSLRKQEVTSLVGLGLADFLRKGIAQPDGSVKHKSVQRRVFVADEI